PKGIFWIGSHALGLLRFDPKTKQFTSYKHDPRDPTTLSNDRVNSVHFDRSGAMWVGTQNGLNKFDPETGKSVAFYESAGLPGNLISCILDDADGNLWMSTNNGLAKFRSEEHTSELQSRSDLVCRLLLEKKKNNL